jgi:hypothetical protein
MAIVEIRFVGKDETGAAAKSAASAVREIGPAAAEAGNGMQGLLGMFDNLTIAAGPVLGAIQGGFNATLGAGLAFNNQMEQTSAKINAFTKDGAATAEILDMIKTRAAATPFEFSAMADAAAALMPAAKQSGMALEDLIAQAEILAASNPAEGLDGAAFALREALSGDYTSIIERFNLSRTTLNELKAQGVPAMEAIGIAMGEMGYDSSLVTNMAATMDGRMSTLKDTFTGLMSTVSQPLFDAMSGGVAIVNDLLTANAPLLQSVADIAAGALSSAIQGAIALFTQWGPVVMAAMGQVAGVVGPVITTIAGLFASGGSSVNTWGTAFTTAQSLVTGVMGAIQGIVGPILAIIAGFWAENGAQILAFVGMAWQQIGAIITTALQIIQAIVIPILTAIGAFIAAHSAEIQMVFSLVWAQIQTIVGGALSLIQGILSTVLAAIQGDWSGAWATLQSTSAQFVTDIITAVQGGMAILQSTITLAWEAIKKVAIGLGGDLVGGIVKGVEAAAGSLLNAMKGIAEGAMNAAKAALGISSPSKRAAEELGLPMIQGWTGKLDAGKDDLAKSMSRLADAAIGGAAPAVAGAAGATGGGGGGGHQITINWYGSGDAAGARGDVRALAYELAKEIDRNGS